MTKQSGAAWRAARRAAGLSGQQVFAQQIRRGVPDGLIVDPAKLSRLERGESATVLAQSLKVLAEIYEVDLMDIDPDAVTAWENERDLVISLKPCIHERARQDWLRTATGPIHPIGAPGRAA